MLVHNKCTSNQELNKLKIQALNGNDLKFDTVDDALNFITKKFPEFIQEVAGSRSAQGWHFDIHKIEGMKGFIEHINLYSKKYGFRIHIFWGN